MDFCVGPAVLLDVGPTFHQQSHQWSYGSWFGNLVEDHGVFATFSNTLKKEKHI